MSVGRTNQGPSSNILVLLQAFIDDCRLYSESIYEDVEQGDDSPWSSEDTTCESIFRYMYFHS